MNINRMIRPLFILLLAAALGWPAVSFGSAKDAPLIPMQDFFRNPEKVSFTLSPDGKHIAFLMSWKDRFNVYVQKVGEDKPVRITSAEKRDIPGYAWANNERITYVQDTGGDENFRLYAVNIDGSSPRALTPFPNVKVRIVDRLEDDDNEMLIAMNKRDPKIFDVYRIDVNTGRMSLIAENPGDIEGWLTDNQGKLRVAVATDGLQSTLLYRKTEAEPFRPVLTTDFKDSIDPLFFTFDDKHLYVASNMGRDKSAIYTFDVENGRNLKLIYERPDVDVDHLIRSKKRKCLIQMGKLLMLSWNPMGSRLSICNF